MHVTEGGKFSTGGTERGVFMDTALELLPSDYWSLLPDGVCAQSVRIRDFTWQHFARTTC
jgi:hypothetical protein